jgi:hypothetical protein
MFNALKANTRHQKGRRWATLTLVLCGAFSLWANVRSGNLGTENIVISAFPPIVAFATSHLIGYFNPRKMGQKVLVWGGMGSVMVFAMIGSGTHIADTVIKEGQPWYIGIVYIFITDAPMLLAGAILVEKVPTAQTVQSTQPVSSPAKRTPAKKAATKAIPAKAPTRTKSASQAVAFKPPSPLTDPAEKDMLTA